MGAQAFGSTDEPLWIPESLRVYRSFIAKQWYVDDDAELVACAWNRETYDPTVRTYQAHCIYSDVEMHTLAAREGRDRCPLPECTCGYYAYYDQQRHGGSFRVARSVPLHGVVQVSGRVLMGTRGVRAEKMRIEALALHPPDAYDADLRGAGIRHGWLSRLGESERSYLATAILEEGHEFDWTGADTQFGKNYLAAWTEARALTILRSASLVYGVVAYPTVHDMWAAHPQPDIDHLIPLKGKP
jgi:hypothetical protein